MYASYAYKEYSNPFKKFFKQRKQSYRQIRFLAGTNDFAIPFRKSNTPHEEYVKERERERKEKHRTHENNSKKEF